MSLTLKIGLAINRLNRLTDNGAIAYTEAVETAGGTVDSLSCVRGTFAQLGSIVLPLLAEAQAYKADVITAGEEVESLFCVRDTFLNLD